MNLNIIFVLCLAVGIVSSGCERRQRDFNTLRLAIGENPTTLDPALIVDVAGGSIAAKLFNGLVKSGEDLSITGDIASDWKISDEGKRYVFSLRDDVSFHNGRKVNARDIKYSFERVIDPATGSARSWVFEKIKGVKDYQLGKTRNVDGIKIVDDKTIEIELEEPFGPFLWLLTMPNAYIVPREEVKRWGKDFSSHVCGTGPYKLKEWRHDYHVVMTSNNDYFGKKPQLAQIEYRVIPDEFSSFTEFENGMLDIVEVPRAEYKLLLADAERSKYVKKMTGMNVYYLGFNCSRAPFDDPLVRKAINYAIDRKKIADKLLNGRAAVARSVLPPSLAGSSEPRSGYEYDPQKAKELLKAAGYGNGLEISIYQNRTREASNILEAVQHYLAKVGIKAHITEREWSSFKEEVIKGKPDMFLLSWWADYPDAENFFYPNFHSSNFGAGGNKARFSDKEIDDIIERSQVTSDEKSRSRMYEKLNKMLFESAPWVFLWHKEDSVIVQPWVKGYRLHPIYNSDKGTDVWIDKKEAMAD